MDRQQENAQAAASTTTPSQDGDAMGGNVLLKLAKKHGMNTDIRRSIFVVLMSSDVSLIVLARGACAKLCVCRITSMLVNVYRNSSSPKFSSGRSCESHCIAVEM